MELSMPATNDLTQIDPLLDSLLSEPNRALARQIARCVLDMKNVYPTLDFKAYKTGKGETIDDIRFCFDRGQDCYNERILTAFLIISRPIKLNFSVYENIPDNINVYLEPNFNANIWRFILDDYLNINNINLIKQIIYFAFKTKAEKFGLEVTIPKDLSSNLNPSIDKKSTICPSEEFIENFIKVKNIIDANDIFNAVEQYAQESGYHLAEGWQEMIKNRYAE